MSRRRWNRGEEGDRIRILSRKKIREEEDRIRIRILSRKRWKR